MTCKGNAYRCGQRQVRLAGTARPGLRKRHILAPCRFFSCVAVSAAENFSPPDDPKPLPPERPGDNECCQSGCDPCVFDFYNDEMDRYRQELKAWEARQAAHAGVSTPS